MTVETGGSFKVPRTKKFDRERSLREQADSDRIYQEYIGGLEKFIAIIESPDSPRD